MERYEEGSKSNYYVVGLHIQQSIIRITGLNAAPTWQTHIPGEILSDFLRQKFLFS